MSTVLIVGAGETGERLPAGVCGLEPRGDDDCECPRDGACERIDAADTAGGVWRAAFASVNRMAAEGPAGESLPALRREVVEELLDEPASALDNVGDASQRLGLVYSGLRVTATFEFVDDWERELPHDVCICISHEACDGSGCSLSAAELFSSIACLLSGGGDKYGEVPASSAAARALDFLREQ